MTLPGANPGRRSLLARSAVGALVIAAIAAVQLSPLREALTGEGLHTLQQGIVEIGAPAPTAFLLLCAIGIGSGLPRLGFAALGGLAFGWLDGTVIAQLGTVAGCFLNFAWVRYLGRDLARGSRMRAWTGIAARIQRRPIAINVALRLVPVGNSFVLNSFLALCPISSRDFLIGTAIGTFPETLVFALFGAGVSDDSRGALGAGTALLLALAGGSYALARRMRAVPERT
jgi:uncharacterized membrane protein YdjX (TVP38/TMEM64 family)